MTERRIMMKNHLLTNVTAIMTIFVVLLTPGFAQSKPTTITNPTQVNNLTLAHTIGKEVGYPDTIQAIMLQESNGGLNPRLSSSGSYGIMQVQVVAARSVFIHYPDLSNRYFPGKRVVSNTDIIHLLITNKEANIRIASYHFKLYMTIAKGNWDKAVAGYNRGIGRVLQMSNCASVGYVKDIRSKKTTVIAEFNRNRMVPLS
jgi:hypothetical protein